MPNLRVYPQHSEEELRAAVNDAFNDAFLRRPPETDEEFIAYWQAKIADLFRLPRKFLGFTDEELAANSEYQQSMLRKTTRARRFQRYIDQIRSELPAQEPSGRIFYMDFKYNTIEKPLSGGLEFKLKRLNFGLTDVLL